jgi:hypothetical protein
MLAKEGVSNEKSAYAIGSIDMEWRDLLTRSIEKRSHKNDFPRPFSYKNGMESNRICCIKYLQISRPQTGPRDGLLVRRLHKDARAPSKYVRISSMNAIVRILTLDKNLESMLSLAIQKGI